MIKFISRWMLMLSIVFGTCVCVTEMASVLATNGEAYWLDTDVGGDIDDVLTIVYTKKLLGLSTVHTNPAEKARIAKLILSELNRGDVPVYVGIGYDPATEDRQLFFDQNPMWPKKIFGVPHPQEGEQGIYSHQGKAYRDEYGVFFEEMQRQIEERPACDAIADAANACEGKLNIIAIGPLHNIAAFLTKYPHLSRKVRIWIMGGWFERDGQIQRPGYNTAINLAASDNVFNSGVEVMLVNSQFIQDNDFGIKERDYDLLKLANKTTVATAIWEDWSNWNKGDVFKRKHIADPVTAYLALHSEEILETMPITVTFPVDHQGKLDPNVEGLDILSPDSHRLIHVQPDDESNVKVITKVKDCKKIYTDIMGEVIKCFYPRACEGRITGILNNQQLECKEAARLLTGARSKL